MKNPFTRVLAAISLFVLVAIVSPVLAGIPPIKSSKTTTKKASASRKKGSAVKKRKSIISPIVKLQAPVTTPKPPTARVVETASENQKENSKNPASVVGSNQVQNPAQSFFGQNGKKPLGTLLDLINREDTTRRKPVGNIGVGVNFFLTGGASLGVTVKKGLFFYNLGVGYLPAKTTYIVRGSSKFIFGGGGYSPSKNSYLGGQLSANLISTPTNIVSTGSQTYEVQNSTSLAIGLGITAAIEIRHIWVQATLNTKSGVGVGATYFL